MSIVYTLGESLIDIIFENDEPHTAKAGGSMLNTAVSLGRSGIAVSHISEYSDDIAGNLIHDFLIQNNVDVKYISRYSDGKTALALAFLNKNRDASYSFYKQYPHHRLRISLPVFQPDDILLFGSFYSLQDEVSERILQIVLTAGKNQCTVIYDPNIRNPHKKDIPGLKKRAVENLLNSNIVRASDQDFINIFGIENADQAWEICAENDVQHLIYTMNKNGVYHYSNKGCKYYKAKQINPLSTIGAGDSFNAGLIKCIIESENKIDWDDAINLGIEFATEVCLSMDNYIAP